MNTTFLSDIAQKTVSKAILAADESSGTIQKRFDTIGLTSSPELNRQYRQILFTAHGIDNYISGVILYDETIRQKSDDGTPFPEFLSKKGIVPGIKVDKGALPLPGMDPDTFTQGLDGLGERLIEYKKLGAGFAKWRAVITIEGSTAPRDIALERSAHDLALYALICQQHDIVPIVEPEVLMDGGHSFERDREVTTGMLSCLFEQIKAYGVYMPGIILKPNMITAGTTHSDQKSVSDVAQKTLDVLAETVPTDVPGIAFLSGGQSPDLATEHLNAINMLKNSDPVKYPWRITASYGRALQGETLEAWEGNSENVDRAKKIFIDRAHKVYQASLGTL